MRFLLDIIYESKFSDHSYGFRSNRGCHLALNKIRMTFGYVNWFIEGDIVKQFDNINHGRLIAEITNKIKDQAFIDLIYKAIRIRYGVHKTSVHLNKKGLVQGSIISPILSNIYMDLFDKKVEELIKNFDKGKRKRANPEYTKVIRNGKVPKEGKLIHPYMPKDPLFKRFRYVRYADDFIIGIIGSHNDCVKIKSDLIKILQEELNLELNLVKTKITHAQTDSAFFLGHKIHITPPSKQKRQYIQLSRGKTLVRKTTRPIFDGPIDKIVSKLEDKGFSRKGGNPTKCGRLIHLQPCQIIKYYRSVENGILNFYSMANNYGRLTGRIHYILKYSCALTIASKLRLRTLKKTFSKYGKNLTIKDDNGKIIMDYPTPSYKRSKKNLRKINVQPFDLIDQLAKRVNKGTLDLKGPCIVCGSRVNIEVHHVKHIRKMNEVTKKNTLKARMARMNRKQIPVCRFCHIQIHGGRYDGESLSKLEESYLTFDKKF